MAKKFKETTMAASNHISPPPPPAYSTTAIVLLKTHSLEKHFFGSTQGYYKNRGRCRGTMKAVLGDCKLLHLWIKYAMLKTLMTQTRKRTQDKKINK